MPERMPIDYSIAPQSGEASFIGYERVNRQRWWRYSLGALIVGVGIPTLLHSLSLAPGLPPPPLRLASLRTPSSSATSTPVATTTWSGTGTCQSGSWALPAVILMAFAECGFAKSDPAVNQWGPPRK